MSKFYSKSKMNFGELPTLIQVQIFRCIPIRKRPVIRLVCRDWDDFIPFMDIRALDMDNFDAAGSTLTQDQTEEMLSFFCQKIGKHLEVLDFGKKKFTLTGSKILEISKFCPNLHRLFGYELDVQVSNIPLLEMLADLGFRKLIYNGGLTEEFFQFIGSLKNLQIYGLERHDYNFLQSVECDSLKVAHIWWLKRFFSDPELALLCSHCPEIKELAIPGSNVTNLASIATLKNLEYLSLEECTQLSMEDCNLDKIAKNCHKLQHLDLTRCRTIWDFQFLNEMSSLKSLNLQFTNFDLHNLQSLHLQCPLENLSLKATPAIYDLAIETLIEKKFPLKSLDLSFNVGQTTATGLSTDLVIYLLQNQPKLEILKLADNKSIGDAIFAEILKSGSQLIELNIQNTACTSDGLDQFIAERGNLVTSSIVNAIPTISRNNREKMMTSPCVISSESHDDRGNIVKSNERISSPTVADMSCGPPVTSLSVMPKNESCDNNSPQFWPIIAVDGLTSIKSDYDDRCKARVVC